MVPPLLLLPLPLLLVLVLVLLLLLLLLALLVLLVLVLVLGEPLLFQQNLQQILQQPKQTGSSWSSSSPLLVNMLCWLWF